VGKLAISIALMGGMILLFYFGGVITDTASSTLLTLILNPEGLEDSEFIALVVGITGTVVALLSFVIAKLTNTDLWYFVPLVGVFLTFGWDFLKVYSALAGSELGRLLAIMLFGPIMVIYVIGVVEWWRGIET